MAVKGARLLAAAVIVACVALIGRGASGGAVSAPALPAGAARDVVPNRVMTWNLCNPCDTADVERAAEIAAHAPQVLAVQEACMNDVDRVRDDLERFYGLRYHVAHGAVESKWSRCGGAPWNPHGYGQAILSAAPIEDVRVTEFPDGGSEDRGYLAVTTTVDGERVRVINTHFAERRQEEVRAGQAAHLAEEVRRHRRVVVVGDFNAVPQAAELAPMFALARDADPACAPDDTTWQCRTTTDWNSKFDYVFLRGGITALRQEVRPTERSDHHVVYADLKVP